MAVVLFSSFPAGLAALEAVFKLISEVLCLNDVVLAADEASKEQVVLFLKGNKCLVVGLSLPIQEVDEGPLLYRLRLFRLLKLVLFSFNLAFLN